MRSRVKDKAGQEGAPETEQVRHPLVLGGSGKVTVLFMGALVLTEKDDP